MSKYSRIGGKFSGKHTTLIPVATEVCDMVERCSVVHRISLGFIKSGLPSAQGKKRVKITEKTGAILLGIRDNTSHQEVHVYASDIGEARAYITQGCRNLGLDVVCAQV